MFLLWDTNVLLNLVVGNCQNFDLCACPNKKGDWEELSRCTDIIFELCDHYIKWHREKEMETSYRIYED